ncbi:hypothetical protein FB45DRAFT_260281 [Roridomyces roridus]|uniref:Protein kinase domain-containing protein n=1 Tax=Roridomyces roridus TaxID=1738132 RepID=A0AAD7B8E7_9AGAR|nr:hypothetical protein FB45DRAFT_260281 [Roridomyces roridus]
MSFISNANGITLGEGTFNNVHGNLVNIFHDGRRADLGDLPHISEMGDLKRKPRRETEIDGLKVIRDKYLDLVLEIGSGPGYFLHAGEFKGRAVIVKVFNAGPTVREHVEATVLNTKGLLHPNVLRMRGRSSPLSSHHFIVYESAYWKAAEAPMAVALKDDLEQSIVLGFKLVAGLSSGMNYLDAQGITVPGVENFDVFLDVNDRFLFSIDFPPSDPDTTENRDVANGAWNLFNVLCQKVLRSANLVLHDEDIERTPVFDSSPPISSPAQGQAITPEEEQAMSNDLEEAPPVPPRREYVWRTLELPQSLGRIATEITRDLEVRWRSINRLTWMDARSVHRCPGYVRQEITLTTRTADSAVVTHNAPAIQEVCSVCHEAVNPGDVFSCVCGADPGSRPTVKCRSCKTWSHRDCAPAANESACQPCFLETSGSTRAAGAQDQEGVAEADPGRLDFEQVTSTRPADTAANTATNNAHPQSNRNNLNNRAQDSGWTVDYEDVRYGWIDSETWSSTVRLGFRPRS